MIIIVALVIIVLLMAYAYYGGFYNIVIRTEKAGGEIIVYKKVKGDYKQTKLVSDEIYSYLLNNMHINTFKGIGVYYDDPKKVKKENLRSEVGCIIETEDIDKLNYLSCIYEIKELPVKESAIVEFPFTGFISVIIGLIRVYPNMNKPLYAT